MKSHQFTTALLHAPARPTFAPPRAERPPRRDPGFDLIRLRTVHGEQLKADRPRLRP